MDLEEFKRLMEKEREWDGELNQHTATFGGIWIPQEEFQRTGGIHEKTG